MTGAGVADQLCAAIRNGDWSWRPDGEPTLFGTDADPAVWLVLPTTRLMVESGADWLCTENVRATRPLADAQADVLTEAGYRCAVWEWNAADYGVPQARRRVSLVASRTHDPTPLKVPAAPARTMAEVLRGIDRSVIGMDRRAMYRDGAPTVRVVPLDEPAPSITSTGLGGGVMRWATDTGDHLPVTVAQGARLQAFPDSHPWVGTPRSRGRQVGNAVPPPMAAVVAGTAAGVDWRPAVTGYLHALYR
jgi:DNA (cytosine-5)-methyltransferase 1